MGISLIINKISIQISLVCYDICHLTIVYHPWYNRTMLTYPVCLVGLEGRRIIVIGGGAVAARKVQTLLEAGANITVISPEFCQDLYALQVDSGRIEMVARHYQPGDLEGAFLVIAATDDPPVNEAVWEESQRHNCLVNIVDDPAHCNFIVPAVVERGDLKIAITTGGASPALARRLREQLEAQIGPEYGMLAALLGELRPLIIEQYEAGPMRLQAALSLLDADLLDVLQQEGYDPARRRALELLSLSNEAMD